SARSQACGETMADHHWGPNLLCTHDGVGIQEHAQHYHAYYSHHYDAGDNSAHQCRCHERASAGGDRDELLARNGIRPSRYVDLVGYLWSPDFPAGRSWRVFACG